MYLNSYVAGTMHSFLIKGSALISWDVLIERFHSIYFETTMYMYIRMHTHSYSGASVHA